MHSATSSLAQIPRGTRRHRLYPQETGYLGADMAMLTPEASPRFEMFRRAASLSCLALVLKPVRTPVGRGEQARARIPLELALHDLQPEQRSSSDRLSLLT